MATITASKLAQYILAQSQERGAEITNLKLQKLLYYCQGWYLALQGESLFPERIEAWVHGPAVPPVFGEYKQHRWRPIPSDDAIIVDPGRSVAEHTRQVLDAYIGLTGRELEALTHREPPWLQARAGIPLDQPSNAIITTESMKQYFKDQSPD